MGLLATTIFLPDSQDERSVAHEIAWLGPRGSDLVHRAELEHGGGMNRQPGEVGQKREEIGDRILQAEAQHFRRDRFGSDLGKIADPARVERLGVHEAVEHVGVGAAEGRGQDALE